MSFAVNSDEVSMVAVRVNGELTELECVETADGYLFTVTGLTADDEIEIVIALLGDINLNGEANSEDLALFARYTFRASAPHAISRGVRGRNSNRIGGA